MTAVERAADTDMELRKGFMELQQTIEKTNQSLQISDIKIDSLKKDIAISKITEEEICRFPSGTPLYHGIGRMFVQKGLGELRKDLSNKIKACEKEVESLESGKKYLERNMKNSEDNLRELIRQRQQNM